MRHKDDWPLSPGLQRLPDVLTHRDDELGVDDLHLFLEEFMTLRPKRWRPVRYHLTHGTGGIHTHVIIGQEHILT